MEPPDSRSYNMSSDHANRAKLWRCTQRKLFRRERCNSLNQLLLVDIPAFVQCCQCGLLIRHIDFSPLLLDTFIYSASDYRPPTSSSQSPSEPVAEKSPPNKPGHANNFRPYLSHGSPA